MPAGNMKDVMEKLGIEDDFENERDDPEFDIRFEILLEVKE